MSIAAGDDLYASSPRPPNWLVIPAFVVCALRTLIGGLRLEKELRSRNPEYWSLGAAWSFLIYPFIRKKVNSRAADHIWLVLLADVSITITAIWLLNLAERAVPPA